MSTKINIRSPYFLEFTEPTQTLGIFTCTTAGLTNFSIDSSGVINNPNIRKGAILDQTAYSFPANEGTTPIPRSVTYTITIPLGYTNTNDSTIECVQTFDQPVLEPAQDPSQNPLCPTYTGVAVPDILNATPSSIQTFNASDFFVAGTDGISAIDVYRQSGSVSVIATTSGTHPNIICSVQSDTSCVSAEFFLTARGFNTTCKTTPATFSFTTSGCAAFDCEEADINETTGNIEQNGTVHKSTWNLGGLGLNKLLYGATDITTSLNVGANNTGSDRSIVLTYRFNIPLGYTNSGTFDCNVPYIQPASATLPTFECGDAQITGTFISDKGNIAAPTLTLGTLISWTPQSFPTVSIDTPRTITLTIEPPANGFSNSGGANITCPVNVVQPALAADCGTTTVFLSQGYSAIEDVCFDQQAGRFWQTSNQVSTNATSASVARYQYGNRMCYGTTPIFGGNKWYIITETQTTGDALYNFYAIKIDNYGIVQDSLIWNCGSVSGGGGGNI